MVLAVVKKELRETRAFAALAIGVFLVYLSKLTGTWSPLFTSLFWWAPGMRTDPPEVPFVQDGFSGLLFFIGAGLAIALGFRQSAWEPSQGTALYLLHLPLGRRAILATKLLTGIGLLLGCTLLPIMIYAVWAATPRTHPSPFEWSMTEPVFHVWMFLPVLYLGAFASGIRPARWFGSRLFPLVGALTSGIVFGPVPSWWLVAFPILLFVAAVLVSDIFLEAETRDF